MLQFVTVISGPSSLFAPTYTKGDVHYETFL